jgi:hypothetical protein
MVTVFDNIDKYNTFSTFLRFGTFGRLDSMSRDRYSYCHFGMLKPERYYEDVWSRYGLKRKYLTC